MHRTALGRIAISGALAACFVSGCSGRPAPKKHEVLMGTVESFETNTGQLTLRTSIHAGEHEDLKMACMLTNDTEVYINDRWRNPQAILAGDTVELIGYRESDPRGEHFVVSLANIQRDAAPPPLPDLSSPLSPASPAVQESQHG
jgi:hypothetical protein